MKYSCHFNALYSLEPSKPVPHPDTIAALPENRQLALDRRYSSLTKKPREIKFIDRLVADSRAVALNHTAGVSLPQQLQMTLFALAGLLDVDESYKDSAKRLIRRRHKILYQAFGITPPSREHSVDYYALLDLEAAGKQLCGSEFSELMMQRDITNEFLFRLARETSVVLLPGNGF